MWMIPLEYKLLQGADDFPLVGKTKQQQFGFGDAVCIPVIECMRLLKSRHCTTLPTSLLMCCKVNKGAQYCTDEGEQYGSDY
jgi:hypothetical protein